MNKLLIVLLAVCLVSVHAFVKRDATVAPPASTDTYVENIKASLEGIAKEMTGKFHEALDPEKVKKQLNDIVDAASKIINSKN